MSGRNITAMTLREARLAKKLTQDQLAAKSGICQAAISSLERGDVQAPSWDTVAKLCRVLKVKPHEVFPVPEHSEAHS